MHEVGELTGWAYAIITVLKVGVAFVVVLLTVAMLTLLERKIAAWIQDRLGPNRVGPSGLLQPFADGLKNFAKEETNPGAASRVFFWIAPMIALTPAFVVFAIVPFAAPLPTPWGVVDMIVADVPVGILFLLALASLGVYGIVMAGWSSNNKYAFLGALRASAQMVSYEVGLGMSLIPVFILAGNVTLTHIVWTQQEELGVWLAFPLGLAFVLFVISALAETNRLPFDVAEAESELVSGYHTEYSSMKFSMFFMAEYANLLTSAALMATLFFGGWDIPFFTFDNMRVIAPGVVMGAEPAVWKTLLTFLAFVLKTLFFVFMFMWIRWTVPRFRYDQIMHLGWKVVLPSALAFIVVISTSVLVLDGLGLPYGVLYGLILTAVNLVCMALFFWLVDRDRVIGGSYGTEKVRALRAGRMARGVAVEPAPVRPAAATNK
ncbi:MAG: NADH-quinone oxidoreductase subunit NuoH [Gemmatimonadota bacterium]